MPRVNSSRRIITTGLAALLSAASVSQGAATVDAQAAGRHVVTHDGLRLSYRTVGTGPNTIVLPLGFMLGDFERLAAPDRTLVFYDQRNRGRSEAVAPDKLSLHDEVRDMETLRAHLGVRTFTPIGYSYLGLMVMLYAVDHPERIQRVVQLGPVPMRFGTEYPPNLRSDDGEAVMGAERLAELRKLRDAGLHEQRPREYLRTGVGRVSLWPDRRPVEGRRAWRWPLRAAERMADRLHADVAASAGGIATADADTRAARVFHTAGPHDPRAKGPQRAVRGRSRMGQPPAERAAPDTRPGRASVVGRRARRGVSCDRSLPSRALAGSGRTHSTVASGEDSHRAAACPYEADSRRRPGSSVRRAAHEVECTDVCGVGGNLTQLGLADALTTWFGPSTAA